MPTQKKGCDDDEIVGLFSPQRRLFRKSKAAVLFRAKVSYRLMYILHESAMTPTHSSLGTLILCSFLCLIVLHNKQSNIFQHNKYVGMGKYELVCAGTGSILHRITLKYVGMGL